MQSDQDHPQDTAEAFAKLFEKTLGYVPRAPIEGLNDGDYQPRSLPPPVPHLLGMLDAPPITRVAPVAVPPDESHCNRATGASHAGRRHARCVASLAAQGLLFVLICMKL